jgi:DNA-binding transcriptional ArsR family regulator
LEPKTQGAWVVHHADKLGHVKEPATFENILVAGKSSTVLAAIAASDEVVLKAERVRALARANGVNQLELDSVLTRLESRRLIVRDSSEVQVLAVTTASVLQHTASILDDLSPTPIERASLELAELASEQPVDRAALAERLGDEHRLAGAVVDDLLFEAEQIGFVDTEGQGTGKLYFNGNLFRRDSIEKTQRVLDSLAPDERANLRTLEQELTTRGCISLPRAEKILGTTLLSKVNAIGLFDIHGVQNEKGSTLFVTRPAAFSKFGNPFVDDALDLAKALVACFTYGMTERSASEGRIRMPGALIRKLVNGDEVGGRAPAIGKDYQALEYKGVVKVRREGNSYYMTLLKRDVGELALSVLTSGDASYDALSLQSAHVAAYIAPERQRVATRKAMSKKENQRAKVSVDSMLQALREQ